MKEINYFANTGDRCVSDKVKKDFIAETGVTPAAFWFVTENDPQFIGARFTISNDANAGNLACINDLVDYAKGCIEVSEAKASEREIAVKAKLRKTYDKTALESLYRQLESCCGTTAFGVTRTKKAFEEMHEKYGNSEVAILVKECDDFIQKVGFDMSDNEKRINNASVTYKAIEDKSHVKFDLKVERLHDILDKAKECRSKINDDPDKARGKLAELKSKYVSEVKHIVDTCNAVSKLHKEQEAKKAKEAANAKASAERLDSFLNDYLTKKDEDIDWDKFFKF